MFFPPRRMDADTRANQYQLATAADNKNFTCGRRAVSVSVASAFTAAEHKVNSTKKTTKTHPFQQRQRIFATDAKQLPKTVHMKVTPPDPSRCGITLPLVHKMDSIYESKSTELQMDTSVLRSRASPCTEHNRNCPSPPPKKKPSAPSPSASPGPYLCPAPLRGNLYP